MPVEPWIPLAGRPLQLPSIQEQLNMREFARQMQVRQQLQQLQNVPGMVQRGMYTQQGLVALGQIDVGLRDDAVRRQAQIMAQESLEADRIQKKREAQIEQTRQIRTEAQAAWIAEYEKSGDESKATAARNAKYQQYIDDGRAKDLGWEDKGIQMLMGEKPSLNDYIINTMGPQKGLEEIKYRGDIEREKQGQKPAGRVMEYQGKPVEGISEEGLPLSDVTKALQTRGLTQEPPVEQRELEPEKQHVEPPAPTEQPREQTKTQPDVPGLEAREVTAERPPVTVEGLYKEADQLFKDAEQAQSPKRRKELIDAADKKMRHAEALDRSINAERRTDIMEDKLKLAVQRVAATQQPLDPRTAALLGEAVAKGNYAIAAGLARNQVAQRQVKEAMGEYARSHNIGAAELNQAHMKFSGAMKAQAGFMAGPEARNITAINTAIGHMGTMSQLADALATSNSQAINAVINAVSKQFGDPSITNFNIARGAVANELMRVFRQVGADRTSVEEWEKEFSSAQTPDQIRGALNTASKLLKSRIDSIRDQARRAGIDIPEILSPEAEQSLKNIGGKVRFKPPQKSQPGELATPRSNPQVIHWDDLK